jgi:hypothetical protein
VFAERPFGRFALRSDGFSLWVRADNGSVRQVSAGDVGGIARRYFHRADRSGGVIHTFLIVHRPDRRCIFKLGEERWKHPDLEEVCRVLGRREAWPVEIRPVTAAQLVREFPGRLSLGERHPAGVILGYLAAATAVVALLVVIFAR